MNKKWKIPPANKYALSTPIQLVKRLRTLIGREFPLTRKSRTDGSNIRKLVAATLQNHPLPELASKQSFDIVPPKRKGVPKLLREFIDTYIVTTGNTYNLQVWNRNPASESVQVQYSDGTTLSAIDVRFVFVPINPETQQISSIVILSPQYIEASFGRFGIPTIKHQLIISRKARDLILSQDLPVLVGTDSNKLDSLVTPSYVKPAANIHAPPQASRLYSLPLIEKILSTQLLNKSVPADATKNRGQNLERIVAELLGYTMGNELLAGGYPDITNQLLEVKIQDSPTVDLGRYSPQFEESLPLLQNVTTRDVRYLIALMDAGANRIAGLVICPGYDLGKHFTYVADKSYKCQRSIPMEFFHKFEGKSVYNP